VFGIAISNIKGYRCKKALFLVGEGETGKSQIRALVEECVGLKCCSSAELSALERPFTLGTMFGKRLAGSNDLGFTDLPEVKTFKQLTGGDMLQFEKKFGDPFMARFNGIMWYSMNKLPSFSGDRGKHVFERILIVECAKAIDESKRDANLLEKMRTEKESFVRECVILAARVKNRNWKLTIPESSVIAVKNYRDDISSARTFLKENGVLLNKHDVECWKSRDVYSTYKVWSLSVGFKPMSSIAFFREAIDYYEIEKDTLKFHKKSGNYCTLKLDIEDGLEMLN
jgi:P4 family phage/plasmid primase-like protien